MKFYSTGKYSWTKAGVQKRLKVGRKRYGKNWLFKFKALHTKGKAHKRGYVIFAAKKRR